MPTATTSRIGSMAARTTRARRRRAGAAAAVRIATAMAMEFRIATTIVRASRTRTRPTAIMMALAMRAKLPAADRLRPTAMAAVAVVPADRTDRVAVIALRLRTGLAAKR